MVIALVISHVIAVAVGVFVGYRLRPLAVDVVAAVKKDI
jgi:hypothetical protein